MAENHPDLDLCDDARSHDASRRFAAAYDRRATQYANAVEPTFAPIYRRIVQLAAVGQGMKVLDLATGTGGVAREAAAAGADVIGIDISSRMLEIARRTCPPTASFQLAEASALPFVNGSFDVTTCSFGLSHMPQAGPVLSQVRRVLKPEGRFVASCWGQEAFNPSRDAVQATLDRYGQNRSDPFGDIMNEELWKDPQRGLTMLREAGFDEVNVAIERLEGVFAGATEALDRALAGPSRGELADAIAEGQRPQFRADALAAIEATANLSWWWLVDYYIAVAPMTGG